MSPVPKQFEHLYGLIVGHHTDRLKSKGLNAIDANAKAKEIADRAIASKQLNSLRKKQGGE